MPYESYEMLGDGRQGFVAHQPANASIAGRPETEFPSHSDHANQDSIVAGGETAPISETIAEIRAFHRRRVFAMDLRKRSDAALGAFLRIELGWKRSLSAAERNAIKAEAKRLIALGEKADAGSAGDDPRFADLAPIILGSLASRAPFEAIERTCEAAMERLARRLPVWPWFRDHVFKTTALQLAVIVAETGDLSAYANPAKVWKRMGLAVIGGTRQGGLGKTAAKADWVAHGYSRSRRSLIWVAGDALIKKSGPWYALYRERKAEECRKAEAAGLIVMPANHIPSDGRAHYRSLNHIHRRAQRYMEKRLLRDLWRAWRRAAKMHMPPKYALSPDASNQTELAR